MGFSLCVIRKVVVGMKRFVSLLLVVVCLLGAVPNFAFAAGQHDISAESYIVTDDLGLEVFSCNADAKMPPASTAKLLTALVAAENCNLASKIKVTNSHTATEGSLMYLAVGETLTLEDLLYGLLLASGNDAALCIAELVSGSTEDFVKLMNIKAAELGMDSSRFSNPSGLPDENCFTTARDMVRLMAAFSKNEELMKISGTREAVLEKRTVVNHNRLISSVAGVDGGKTGYTKAAGRCLVTTAERNGRRFYVCTLNAPNDWEDHKTLYEMSFGRLEKVELGGFLPVSQDIVGGRERLCRVQCSEIPCLWLTKDETENLSSVTYMRRFEYAGVKMGEVCGRTDIFCGGKLVFSVPLYYAQSVAKLGGSENYLDKKLTAKEYSF